MLEDTLQYCIIACFLFYRDYGRLFHFAALILLSTSFTSFTCKSFFDFAANLITSCVDTKGQYLRSRRVSSSHFSKYSSDCSVISLQLAKFKSCKVLMLLGDVPIWQMPTSVILEEEMSNCESLDKPWVIYLSAISEMSVPLNFKHFKFLNRLFESVPGLVESFGGDKISLIAWSLSPRTKLRLSDVSWGHRQVCSANTDWMGTPSKLSERKHVIREIIHANCCLAIWDQSSIRFSGWRRTIAIRRLAVIFCSAQFIFFHNCGLIATSAHTLHTVEHTTRVSWLKYWKTLNKICLSNAKFEFVGDWQLEKEGRTGNTGFFKSFDEDEIICCASWALNAFRFLEMLLSILKWDSLLLPSPLLRCFSGSSAISSSPFSLSSVLMIVLVEGVWLVSSSDSLNLSNSSRAINFVWWFDSVPLECSSMFSMFLPDSVFGLARKCLGC